MFKRPALGWRTKNKLLKEFHQGGIATRWSERRLLILLAEYRMNCRREFMAEIEAELRDEPMSLSKYFVISEKSLEKVAH